jgi:hypothetical protein
MIDDAGNELRLKRRGVWDELRHGDDYALLAGAAGAAMDKERLRVGGVSIRTRMARFIARIARRRGVRRFLPPCERGLYRK